MHPYLIDWFRNVEINVDLDMVEKRWETATIYGKQLTRKSAETLLRLVLFTGTDAGQVKMLTDALLKLDREFPVAGNTEELRLMAGVVMVTTFASFSDAGNAMALGLRAAAPSARQTNPIHPAILTEANKYWRIQGEVQRPDDFGLDSEVGPNSFAAQYEAMKKAETADEAVAIQSAQAEYNAALAKVIHDGQRVLSRQIRRLAEESNLLWWVIGEYSTTLNQHSAELTADRYALVAAAEAADRTGILPPPPSYGALLNRALSRCKPEPKKSLPYSNFLQKSDEKWWAEKSEGS